MKKISTYIQYSTAIIILVVGFLFNLKFHEKDETILFNWKSILMFLDATTLIYFFIVILVISFIISLFRIRSSKFVAILVLCLIGGGLYIAFWNVPQINPDTANVFTYAKFQKQEGLRGFLNLDFNKLLSRLSLLPSIPMIYGFSMLFFGESLFVLKFLNMFFYIGSAVLVFLIGSELYNQRTGFYASILFYSIHNILAQSSLILVDVPMTFFLLLTCYLMIYAVKSRFRVSLMIALSFSFLIALFSKVIAVLFVIFGIIPFLIFLLKKYEIKDKYKKICFASVFITLVILTLILLRASWIIKYINFNTDRFLNYFFIGLNANNFSTITNLVFQLGIPMLLIFLLSIYLIRKDKSITAYYLWIFLPLIILLAIESITVVRYMIPAFPIICIVSALTLDKLIEKKVAVFILISIFLFGVFVSLKGVLPLMMDDANINLKNAAEYIDSLDEEIIGIYGLYEKSYAHPRLLTAVFDLYSKKAVFYKGNLLWAVPSGEKNWEWYYRAPHYYLTPEKPQLMVVLSNKKSESSQMDILESELNTSLEVLQAFDHEGYSVMEVNRVYVIRDISK